MAVTRSRAGGACDGPARGRVHLHERAELGGLVHAVHRAALLAAKTVVYNRASSGQGIEALILKLGLTDQLASRTVRFHRKRKIGRRIFQRASR